MKVHDIFKQVEQTRAEINTCKSIVLYKIFRITRAVWIIISKDQFSEVTASKCGKPRIKRYGQHWITFRDGTEMHRGVHMIGDGWR